MTDWIEVSLRVATDTADTIAQALQAQCHQGVVIEHPDIPADTYDDATLPPAETVVVRGYFPADAHAEEKRLHIQQALAQVNSSLPQPTYSTVNDDDWATAWKAHYKPVRLGERLLVRPRWIDDVELPPNGIEIALDPGMAFGTGTHPTTQLCLEALEGMSLAGNNLLDLGCGSGILSIAAAKLGASRVFAVDVDMLAVDATRENAAYNGVAERITAQQGSLETLITSARRFDVVVVNILARIIVEMCDNHLGDVVRPGGRAIFSGIIEEQADDVEAALRATGLTPLRRAQQGDWILIEATRQG